MEMELIYHSHSLFQHSRHGLSVNQIHISLTFAPSVNQIHISHDICILVLQNKSSSSQIQLDTHLSHKKGKNIYIYIVVSWCWENSFPKKHFSIFISGYGKLPQGFIEN